MLAVRNWRAGRWVLRGPFRVVRDGDEAGGLAGCGWWSGGLEGEGWRFGGRGVGIFRSTILVDRVGWLISCSWVGGRLGTRLVLNGLDWIGLDWTGYFNIHEMMGERWVLA